MCRAMSARCNHPSSVFTSHQITYTVKARGKTVTRPLIVSVKIFRMGESSHVQDRGAAAALHVISRPIVPKWCRMMETAAVSIAHAQEADLAQILELIKELAEYENLSLQAVATEANRPHPLVGPR